MSKEQLIMLTGSNGYVGFNVLHHLLSRGLCVRAVARSPEKATELESHPSLAQLKANLSTVVVPDFTAEDSWTTALTGITHVVHLASPANSTKATPDLTASYVTPAVDNVLALLQAIHSSPASTVRRVVVTSSIVALCPPSHYLGPVPGLSPDATVTHTATSRVQPAPTVDPATSALDAYAISKITALNAAEAWVAATLPRFDVVHVMPALVGGGDVRATTATAELFKSTTCMVLMPTLSGSAAEMHKMFPSDVGPSALVHIADVCAVHAAALLDEARVPHRPGSGACESFLVNGQREPVAWRDVADIVARRFADEVKAGTLKNGGVLKANGQVRWDPTETERRLGLEFKGLEDIVVDVVRQWLDLHAKEEA